MEFCRELVIRGFSRTSESPDYYVNKINKKEIFISVAHERAIVAGTGGKWRTFKKALDMIGSRCKKWRGPGGTCTTCGVTAYLHLNAPTPVARGCKKFVAIKNTGCGLGDARWCEYCHLPFRDHKREILS